MTRHIICMLTLFAATAAAQEPRRYELRISPADDAVHEKAQIEGKLRVAVEMKTTVGAPYSGEATTEAVQTLADGNRIVRRTVVRIYRDSEGRVRRENLSPDGSRVASVTIVDPVSGGHIALDPERKLAFGDPVTTVSLSGDALPKQAEHAAALAERRKVLESAERTVAKMADAEKSQAEIAMRGAPRVPAPAEMTRRRSPGPEGSGQTSREDLGQRTVEGVVARGSRTTTVLPPGAIGNEQPIRIVSEEWFAPDLQVLVFTKHSDPRSGDTTYTLANINRAEPDRSLFEVPADYTLTSLKRRE